MGSTEFIALVTGVNSGLGTSIVTRLITDFLNSHPPTSTLHIVFTTRSATKGAAALSTFLSHTSALPSNAHTRIKFSSFQVDLTSLHSVIALASQLNSSLPHLDCIILNAGIGGFTGIDWIRCFISLAKNWIKAVTYPEYKIQAIGKTIKQPGDDEELGEVFCANVFGHYYLAHEVMPLLRAGGSQTPGADAGRVIWVSSLEAYAWSFNRRDVQGIKATHAYESSKRLADILALSSDSPATLASTQTFFAPSDIKLAKPRDEKEVKGTGKVRAYVTHPGICATAIIQLHFLLQWCMTLSFYVARWLGSPWHTITTWNGAASMTWLALASDDELVEKNATGIKWGSAVTRGGDARVIPTEVEGKGTKEWEEDSKAAWEELENLRKLWKKKLEG